MKMKERKLTRKEKSIINKAAYAEVKKEKVLPEIKLKEIPVDKEEKKRVFCELIAKCTPIYKAVKQIGIVEATVYSWLDKDEEFLKSYTRAREQQAEKLVEEMLEISDASQDDLISDENGQRVDQEVIARSRLRVETRKWIASKMKPRVYGDSTKIQAEIKDTSSTSSWLGEVLSEIDNNK